MAGFKYGKNAVANQSKRDSIIHDTTWVYPMMKRHIDDCCTVSFKYGPSKNGFGNIVVQNSHITMIGVDEKQRRHYDVDLSGKDEYDFAYMSKKGDTKSKDEYTTIKMSTSDLIALREASERKFKSSQIYFAIDQSKAKKAADAIKKKEVETLSETAVKLKAEVPKSDRTEKQPAAPSATPVAAKVAETVTQTSVQAAAVPATKGKLCYLNNMPASSISNTDEHGQSKVILSLPSRISDTLVGSFNVSSKDVLVSRDWQKNNAIIPNQKNIRLGQASAELEVFVVQKSVPMMMKLSAEQIVDLYAESKTASKQKGRALPKDAELAVQDQPSVSAQDDFRDPFERESLQKSSVNVERVAAAESVQARVGGIDTKTVQEFVDKYGDNTDDLQF